MCDGDIRKHELREGEEFVILINGNQITFLRLYPERVSEGSDWKTGYYSTIYSIDCRLRLITVDGAYHAGPRVPKMYREETYNKFINMIADATCADDKTVNKLEKLFYATFQSKSTDLDKWEELHSVKRDKVSGGVFIKDMAIEDWLDQ
jgi:hypothetical protein